MAVANRNTIRAVIEGRLATELAASPVLPVVFHNMAYEPTPGSSWVQCLASFGSSQYLTHGGLRGGNNRVVGVVVLNVFTPLSVGTGANFVIAKRIRDLYNRVIVSGVYFDAPIGPEVLASASPEGYFQTQVRVTFEFIEEL
tara:strand:- start:339 stop:764 length:426 start_codon:yes stop_codon:yes gene_type:complete